MYEERWLFQFWLTSSRDRRIFLRVTGSVRLPIERPIVKVSTLSRVMAVFRMKTKSIDWRSCDPFHQSSRVAPFKRLLRAP